MTAPKFKLGAKVRITGCFDQEDLRGRVGFVADPGDHARKHKPKWPPTYWKPEPAPSQRVRIVYWIEFGCDSTVPGTICAATVSEEDLILA